MISKPMDVLSVYPVRKTKKQKESFRNAVCSYAQTLGYTCRVEKGSFGSRNVIIGDDSKAKYLITAHYDTCARLPIPNFITPSNFWMFLLYQFAMLAVMYVPIGAVALAVRTFIGQDFVFPVAYFGLLLILLLMFAGPANRNNANDNTSGVVGVLEVARALPDELCGQVAFVLFDLEEAGLIGSDSYHKKHKTRCAEQLILNLDCIGDGDDIVLFPTRGAFRMEHEMERIRNQCGAHGEMKILVRKRGFAYYPSDQAKFSRGIGICALRYRKGIGHYMGRIHTPRDTILQERNIIVLRDWLLKLVGNEERK